jgi:hypothetical protein
MVELYLHSPMRFHVVVLTLNLLSIFSWLINFILLTYGAEPFLRSCQLCIHSRTSQHFMEPEGSLPCSQEPSTGPYPEPNRSSPYHSLYLFYLYNFYIFNTAQVPLLVRNIHDLEFGRDTICP